MELAGSTPADTAAGRLIRVASCGLRRMLTIGHAMLCRMLRDDRARRPKCSVLTASHTGGLLYPRVGYERIGVLFMFVPKRAASA